MSSFVTSLLLAIGGGTWMYTKLNRSTGGNTKNEATGAAIIAFILFLVCWFALHALFHQ